MRQKRAAESCDETACGLAENVQEAAYAYLLGQYLGDGCISQGPRGVFRLRIATCDAYPRVRGECTLAMLAVMPGRRVGRVGCQGCTELYSYSKHWLCLFPQHGRGRKHERPIVLRPWQERIALDEQPQLFLRGLLHSDGCRYRNAVRRPTKSGIKTYTYLSYSFTNESSDIRGLFIEACRRVGVDCRLSNRKTVSVTRRTSVALLDTFIGPKS